MKFSKKILIGLIVFILLMTISYTIIFCIKGSYPEAIYLALIPAIITELIALCKLELDRRKREEENNQNGGQK